MHLTNTTARRAGVVYFIFMLVAIYAEFLLPTFMVPADAAATARNIANATQTYRLGLLMSVATLLIFIVLVVLLHQLFKRVDENLSLLMVLLVAIGISVAFANLHTRFAPLVLQSGADYLSAFGKPQLDAATLGVLRFHGTKSGVTTVFWGLWLFPFGVLVIKSGFLPRVLGMLLLVAGVAYVITSITAIAWPEQRALVSRLMMPLYFGEVPIIFWLLIKGAREPQQQA